MLTLVECWSQHSPHGEGCWSKGAGLGSPSLRLPGLCLSLTSHLPQGTVLLLVDHLSGMEDNLSGCHGSQFKGQMTQGGSCQVVFSPTF